MVATLLPDLVLLPGMDGTGLLFDPFVSAINNLTGVTVVNYPLDSSLNYVQLATVVRNQLPRGKPYVILGESFSGPIAIMIAASAPTNMKALILSCSFAKNPHALLAASRPLLKFLPITKMSWLAHRALLGRHSTRALRQGLNQTLALVPPQRLLERLQAVSQVDVTSGLHRISMPILYLRAKYDRVVPHSSSKLVAAIASQTEIVEVAGPHLLLQANANDAATAVIRFLRQLS